MCILLNCKLCQAPSPEKEHNGQAPSDVREDTNDTQAAGRSPRAEGEQQEAPGEAPEHEAERADEEQQQEVPVRRRQTENEVSEVEIPNVGRIIVRADVDGYNEEVRIAAQYLSPHSQSYKLSHFIYGTKPGNW